MSAGVDLNFSVKEKPNYIQAHQGLYLAIEEHDLETTQAAIVHALFYYWNQSRFKDRFSVSRDQLMQKSRIRNIKTYYRHINEIKHLIGYEPSKNPNGASIFNISKFVLCDGSSDGSSDGLSDGSSEGTIYKHINITNDTKQKEERTAPTNLPIKTKRQVKAKATKANMEPPTLDEVIEYFKAKGYKRSAAEKFHSYYSTLAEDNNGMWVDGNGNIVKNWKQKAVQIWFKTENEENVTEEMPLQMQVLINAAQSQSKVIKQVGKISDFKKVWVYFYTDKATNKPSILYGESDQVEEYKSKIETTGRSWHLYCSDIFNRNPLIKLEV